MEYEVTFSHRALADLSEISESQPEVFSPRERLRYVVELRKICLGLNVMPHRIRRVWVGGREFRRINHKAHAIFFRIIEQDKRVNIEAILHSRSDFARQL